MTISYDREADALYIRLVKGERQCRVVRLSDDIALDFAMGEKLVGIEVLGASRLFAKPEAPEVELMDVLPKVATPKLRKLRTQPHPQPVARFDRHWRIQPHMQLALFNLRRSRHGLSGLCPADLDCAR